MINCFQTANCSILHHMSNHKIYPCLWFNHNAQEAVQYYCSIFKNAKVLSDSGMVVMFELNDTKFMALNGGPHFQFNESISMVLNCEGQDEVDYYWTALTENGGQESQCGWLKDKFGISWQIVPMELMTYVGHSDPEIREYAFQQMLKMKKIEINQLTK